MVSLFDDYAALDRSKSGYLVAGNLVRLTHKGTRGSQDYKRAVSYDDDRGKDKTAFLHIYPKLDVPHCQKFGTRWRLRLRTKVIMAAKSYKEMYGNKETFSNISIMSLRVFGARLETC